MNFEISRTLRVLCYVLMLLKSQTNSDVTKKW